MYSEEEEQSESESQPKACGMNSRCKFKTLQSFNLSFDYMEYARNHKFWEHKIKQNNPFLCLTTQIMIPGLRWFVVSVRVCNHIDILLKKMQNTILEGIHPSLGKENIIREHTGNY